MVVYVQPAVIVGFVVGACVVVDERIAASITEDTEHCENALLTAAR